MHHAPAGSPHLVRASGALRHYAMAAGSVAVALLLTFALGPVLDRSPFLLFFAAIAVVAWYGGLGPGLLATGLSVMLANYFLVPPILSLKSEAVDVLRLAIFALVAALISGLSEARRRAAHAVAAQRTQLQVTLASIGDAVLTTDEAGRVTFLNSVAEVLTGWPLADGVGQPIDVVFRIVNASTRQPVESPVARVLREGVVVGLANHTVLIARDGAERPIDDSGAPIRDLEGALVGVVLVFRDITAREQAEAERRALLAQEQEARAAAERARERLAFLADASTQLAASLDYDATLQRIARLCVPRLADWCVVDTPTPNGTIVMQIVAHVDPEKERWARALRERFVVHIDQPVGASLVIRTGAPQLIPDITDELLQVAARDGEELEILRRVGYRSLLVVPLRDQYRIVGALGLVTTDESGRRFTPDDVPLAEELARRAGAALVHAQLFRAAEQATARVSRLQQVTAALSTTLTPDQVADVMVREGLAAVDADASALFLPRADGTALEARHFLGYPEGLAPRYARVPIDGPGPLRDAFDARALVVAESAEELVTRWPHLRETQAQSGDMACAAVPLLLDAQPLGALYIAFRRPRRFTHADRDFLEALGRQCAQALERARLYVAEQEARVSAEEARVATEAALHQRELFLSVAAHELKTPLTSLLLQVQLLQRRMARAEGSAAPYDPGALRVLAGQSQRLDRMVTALLDVSRIELGQLALEQAPVDLCALTRRAVAELQPTAEAHVLTCDSPEEALLVNGDELRLEQVLQNLLQNAVKYSPGGGPVAVAVTAEHGQVCVTVDDQGIGIPEEALPKLFERFYRAPNAAPRQISGMGIGLYVVREIVRLHGGSVRVERRLAGGSRFTVCLPQAEGAEPSDPPLEQAVAPA